MLDPFEEHECLEEATSFELTEKIRELVCDRLEKGSIVEELAVYALPGKENSVINYFIKSTKPPLKDFDFVVEVKQSNGWTVTARGVWVFQKKEDHEVN